MIDYIYDGTFDGFLTVVWHHYYTDKACGIFTEDRYQPSFLHGQMQVETEPAKSDRVYQAIRQKISEFDLRSIYRAYLSCDPEKEMKILRYVVMGFRHGHRTFSLHGDPVVADFQGILKKISKEQERMLQFVRFSVMEGDVLYARVRPDNDVIELAARHFCDRYHNERFIIHDTRRDKAVIGSGGRWMVSSFTLPQAPAVSEEERSFRMLWRTYFDHIAILERTNSRCQNHFIPDRYRDQLTEIATMEEQWP